jgi:predicted small secreted protein
MKVRPLLILTALLASAALLCACNTMEGLGKDTKKLGEKIEEKAAR